MMEEQQQCGVPSILSKSSTSFRASKEKEEKEKEVKKRMMNYIKALVDDENVHAVD